MMSASTAKLVILYGIGGLSDVGRHAVRAALDAGVGQIRILTQHPHLLDSPDWKSACVDPHIFTDAERKRFQVIKVDLWDDPEEVQRLLPLFADATAVVTCVGNRQPGIYEPELKNGWVSFPANQLVVKAIETYSPQLKRVVAISSVGVAEDWPPMEFFLPAKVILGALFVIPGLARTAYRDLTKADELFRASKENVDYLLVRPVGLGEDVEPVGTWKIQKEKYKDEVGGNMAKLDCARFMVEEALHPTFHRTAVVIGSNDDVDIEAKAKE